MGRLLMVEDDEMLRAAIREVFTLKGYSVAEAACGEGFMTQVEKQDFDLVLLDLNLPDEDGLVLLRRTRARSDVPVFVVSGRTDNDSRLTALELGADDYVTKPFDVRELELRIRNFLGRQKNRRTGGNGTAERPVHRIRFGGWTLLPDQWSLQDAQGQQLVLTRGELDVLMALVKAEGNALSREKLADVLARNINGSNPETVTVLVYRLRKKLVSDSKENPVIVTVPGVGYRIGAEVTYGD
ncbi:response regulator transcription factor [Isoalcanivorax indicus]|uniref:response regulator transcription factor n=1 Tax=Isoalcanivorax indicus TaxID=2202653 RepID=UPI000DBAB30E|nr:response regulator transcription factor [Isoalcanivorax indicus]